MMTKSINPGKSVFTRMMIIPLLILTVGLFSFRKNHLLSHDKTIRVVVDAGHGGNFPGSRAGDVLEKNINLEIARKIHELAPEYHVQVVLSRDKDISPGSNDLTESLDWLAALPDKENADLFISIHANYTQEANASSGFEIYIPGASSPSHEKSALFGTLMTDAIRPDYTIAGELKQRDKSIRILEKATVPALLIECGNMNNAADLHYLTDKQSQEKIARDILKGIQQFEQKKNNKVVSVTETEIVKESVSEVVVSSAIVNTQEDTTPLKKPEVEADYPGGSKGWMAYLSKNLKYPDEAISHEIQGSVIVEFIVQKDGSLSDVHAISGPASLRPNSVNVVKGSGNWVPAKNNGVVVASYKKQPINYVLTTK